MTELRQACKVVIGTSFSHECFLKNEPKKCLVFNKKELRPWASAGQMSLHGRRPLFDRLHFTCEKFEHCFAIYSAGKLKFTVIVVCISTAFPLIKYGR